MTDKKSSGNIFASIWDFFASVKLALTTLFTISLASIIGTVIPQKEALPWYAQKYGPQTAQFIDLFDLHDMYGSLWFKALLGLLSANLIICSLDRFPAIWKQVKTDNLEMPVKRLMSMRRSASWEVARPAPVIVEDLSRLLPQRGWRISRRETEDGNLLFSQKAAWTRLGVFIVHISILIILIGSLLGSIFGYKGSLSIVEGTSEGKIQTYGGTASPDLGFEVRCDAFNIAFYQNGMPKEYRSDLTILEKGREILHKSIKVNSPLTYKGITFYQASYEGYRDFIITLTDTESGESRQFMAPFQKKMEWQEKNLHFGVINAEVNGERIARMKIWFSDKSGEPSVFWVDSGTQSKVERKGKNYLLSAKQMYATGIQVAKDPGVWLVYIGFALLLSGLFAVFFLSHRKIWIFVCEKNGTTHIHLAGSTNKNKSGFDKVFSRLAESIRNYKHS
jgi:cytochrome c biogenesis protein